MGARGPAPRSTAEKVRRGETRPSRLNLSEPIPRDRPPRPPAGMLPAVRTVWDRALREAPKGMIRAIDTDVLLLYCEAVVRYRRASKAYAESIGILRGRDGEMVKNPLHQIVRDNAHEVRALARELGFSPAARSGMHVEGPGGIGGGIDDTIGPPPRLRAMAGGRADDGE